MHLPNGHQQVVPYIMVNDGEVFIKFLQETFNAQVGPIIKSTNGKKITHGELKIGESVLFFADGTEEDVSCDNDCVTNENEISEKNKEKEPSNIHMHVYVKDAAEVVEKAEKAGGTSVMPLMDDESGQMGGFLDPFNNLWWVKSLNQ